MDILFSDGLKSVGKCSTSAVSTAFRITVIINIYLTPNLQMIVGDKQIQLMYIVSDMDYVNSSNILMTGRTRIFFFKKRIDT